MSDFRRREFIALLAASAQQDKRPVKIGFVPLGSPGNAYDRSLVEAFREGLRQIGLVENRDIVLDVAWTAGNPSETVAEVLKVGQSC